MTRANSKSPAFSEPAPQPSNMRLFELAKKKVEDEGITMAQAMGRARLEWPELAEEADFEVTGHRRRDPASGGAGCVRAAESGDAAPNPSELLVTLAGAFCREKRVPYTQAIIEVARAHPDLARAARRQVLGLPENS
jgi:hypothetical protein